MNAFSVGECHPRSRPYSRVPAILSSRFSGSHPSQPTFGRASIRRRSRCTRDQRIPGQSVTTTGALTLDETLRQAYFWIVNHAIISPFYDIEYNDGPPQTYPIGDRREELVRVLLASIDVRPAGETIEQSFDRKATLDSVERSKVMQATIAAEKRARKIREAMARKAA